ncbi:MAG: 30S ribosomal protein S17 [Candidatus Pacearchaeota archaeon]
MKKKEREGKVKEVNLNSIHSNEKYSLRGRKFEGYVVRKFEKRVVIEFERMIYVRKYERYMKKKTRIHARLPESMKDEINIGDYIQVKECRPLSKIIHSVVIKKIRDVNEKSINAKEKEENESN